MRQTIFQQRKCIEEKAGQMMSLYVTNSKILFDPDPSQTAIPTKLLIDRSSHKLHEIKVNDKVPEMRRKSIYGVVGMIKIYGKSSVVYIEDADLVCIINESPVFHIKKVGIMILDTRENDEMLDLQEKEFIQQLSRILQTNFYFSYLVDLTQNLERRHKLLNASYQQASLMQVKQSTNRFWWNQYMMRNFLRDGISESWHLKIIQGYVGSFQTTFKSNKQLHYFLISRRSYLRPGNFQDHQGADEDGNCANYVETEQRMYYDSIQTSFVLVRGSIPLSWSKNKLYRTQSFTKEDLEQSRKSLNKHTQSLIANYSKVACLNLLGKDSGRTAILSQTFENLHSEARFESVGYEYFDFDAVCEGNQFDALNAYIEKMSPIITYFGYFLNEPRYSKTKFQKGVFRVNCFDCLDRTNIYMTKIALKVAQDMMEELGINIQNEFNCQSLVQQADQPSLQNQHPFLIYFKQQWSDSGENIAKYYRSHIDIAAILAQPNKCLDRFIKMNIDDGLRSDVVDQMVGMHQATSQSMQSIAEMEQMLKQRENEFLRKKNVSVYVVTWNINAHTPSNLNANDFSPLLDSRITDPPDLIAVAFQELVKLNAVNVVGNINQLQIDCWRKVIEQTVRARLGEYVVVATSDMVGCLLLILVKKDLQGKVTNVQTDNVKCGFGSQLGNKGGVIIRMSFYDSVVCFINVHLPAGQKKADARLAAIEDIHTKAFADKSVEKSDWVLFMGDTNFRINLSYQQGVQYVGKLLEAQQNNMMENCDQIMQILKDNDQLKIEKSKNQYLKQYQEADISFVPTYKYDIGTNVYDTSKKQRVPSWTDRILFLSQSLHAFVPIFYDALKGPFQVSDHRPVGCYIATSVSQVEESNRDKVLQEIFRNYGEESKKWSDRYYDKTALIQGRSTTVTIFDNSPKKVRSRLNQTINFTALVMDEVIEDTTAPKRTSSILQQSRAGGRREMPDLEELTKPFY